MEIPRPSEDDKKRFRSLVPDDPRVEVKPMFGNLGAFVNGNMFMGLFGSTIGVKLDHTGQQELLAVAGTGPFGPEDRPMGGYVAMPATWKGGEKAADWAARSLSFVAAMPPKKPKAARASKRS